MRTEDEKVALNSITFLNEYSKSINIQSLRSTISKLQESQMQILMIASSSDSYIFKTLDSAVVPEIKLGPKRSLICILGTLLGFMISTLSILILNYFKNPNKNIS
jgi:LPS O-antigen subunit length determinant protein (WzzB/FepE family)